MNVFLAAGVGTINEFLIADVGKVNAILLAEFLVVIKLCFLVLNVENICLLLICLTTLFIFFLFELLLLKT